MLHLVGNKSYSSGLAHPASLDDEHRSSLGGIIAPHDAYYHGRKHSEDALVRLARGIYCDADDLLDLKGFLRKNAVRIANYLFSNAALTHVSAYAKGAVESMAKEDAATPLKLYLAGSHRHSTTVSLLEINTTADLGRGRIGQFLQPLSDGQDKLYGPMGLACLCDEVVFLQQFGRKRSKQSKYLPLPQLAALYTALDQRHGDALVSRLRVVCDEIGAMNTELDGAQSYVHQAKRQTSLGIALEKSALVLGASGASSSGGAAAGVDMNLVYEYEMGWYGRPIAKIINNGVSWSFELNKGWLLPLSAGETRPGVMPAFIQNLFPEGFMNDVLQEGVSAGAAATVLEKSQRYLSNVAIVRSREELSTIPMDVLGARLASCRDDRHIFTGQLYGMARTGADHTAELHDLLGQAQTPRIAGHQPKIPCYLDETGKLMPANEKPFTHVLKLAGLSNDPHYLRGVVEWASMSLAQSAGLKVCDFAMLPMDSGALGYVCERFDIPSNSEDMRLIFAEDFCSLFNKNSVFKYGVEDLAQFLAQYRQSVPKRTEDDEQMFLLIYLNYLLENADFHLKNASVIRVASPALDGFRSTRLSPAYDIMNTRYFSHIQLPQDRLQTMCMGINGRRTELGIEDFHSIADLLGISRNRTIELMSSSARSLAKRATEMSQELPEMVSCRPRAAATVRDMCERAVFMCHRHFPDIELLCPIKDMGRHLVSPLVDGAPAPSDDAESEPQMIRDIKKALKY